LSRALCNAWWLLALCGILDAMHATIYLLAINRWLILRGFASAAGWDMSILALTAGACAIAAGLWSVGKDYSGLLSLHGLALGAFGAIAVSPLVKRPMSFHGVSLLFALMAASIGAFALETAHMQPRGSKGRWFLIAAGAASFSFAFSFIAIGFFLPLKPPNMFVIWMSAYFVFCTVFMLWLAFRLHSRAIGQSDQTEPLSPLPSPRHAY
jgi:hypothetical protein